jgi:hypothetical protein
LPALYGGFEGVLGEALAFCIGDDGFEARVGFRVGAVYCTIIRSELV